MPLSSLNAFLVDGGRAPCGVSFQAGTQLIRFLAACLLGVASMSAKPAEDSETTSPAPAALRAASDPAKAAVAATSASAVELPRQELPLTEDALRAVLLRARWAAPAPGVYLSTEEREASGRKTSVVSYEWIREKGGRLTLRESTREPRRAGGKATRTLRLTNEEGAWELLPKTKVAVLMPNPFNKQALLGELETLKREMEALSDDQKAHFFTVSAEREQGPQGAQLRLQKTFSPEAQKSMEQFSKRMLEVINQIIEAELKQHSFAVRLIARPIIKAKMPNPEDLVMARQEMVIVESSGELLLERAYDAKGKVLREKHREVRTPVTGFDTQAFSLDGYRLLRPVDLSAYVKELETLRKEEAKAAGETPASGKGEAEQDGKAETLP